MFKVKITADKFNSFLKKLPAQFERAALDASNETAETILREMRVPGRPRSKGEKVNWDSLKQMMAYFASDGFGKGIPSVRTNNYIQGYTKTSLPNGFSISNQSPAGAIGGTILSNSPVIGNIEDLYTWQSKIHKGRWKPLVPVIKKTIKGLAALIVQKLRQAARD